MKRNFIAIVAFTLCFFPCIAQEKTALIDSRDHKTYETVKIGDQWWMAKNLSYMPSVSPPGHGVSPLFTDKGIYVHKYFGTDTTEAKKTKAYQTYGCLYNWKIANSVCPAGWHLPTDGEWKQMEKHLGMSSSDLDSVNWRKSGRVDLKLMAKSGWESNPGTNESGFSALPGGFSVTNDFSMSVMQYADFWTATKADNEKAWSRDISIKQPGLGRGQFPVLVGKSVRCVKN